MSLLLLKKKKKNQKILITDVTFNHLLEIQCVSISKWSCNMINTIQSILIKNGRSRNEMEKDIDKYRAIKIKSSGSFFFILFRKHDFYFDEVANEMKYRRIPVAFILFQHRNNMNDSYYQFYSMSYDKQVFPHPYNSRDFLVFVRRCIKHVGSTVFIAGKEGDCSTWWKMVGFKYVDDPIRVTYFNILGEVTIKGLSPEYDWYEWRNTDEYKTFWSPYDKDVSHIINGYNRYPDESLHTPLENYLVRSMINKRFHDLCMERRAKNSVQKHQGIMDIDNDNDNDDDDDDDDLKNSIDQESQIMDYNDRGSDGVIKGKANYTSRKRRKKTSSVFTLDIRDQYKIVTNQTTNNIIQRNQLSNKYPQISVEIDASRSPPHTPTTINAPPYILQSNSVPSFIQHPIDVSQLKKANNQVIDNIDMDIEKETKPIRVLKCHALVYSDNHDNTDHFENITYDNAFDCEWVAHIQWNWVYDGNIFNSYFNLKGMVTNDNFNIDNYGHIHRFIELVNPVYENNKNKDDFEDDFENDFENDFGDY